VFSSSAEVSKMGITQKSPRRSERLANKARVKAYQESFLRSHSRVMRAIDTIKYHKVMYTHHVESLLDDLLHGDSIVVLHPTTAPMLKKWCVQLLHSAPTNLMWVCATELLNQIQTFEDTYCPL
jgi:hypothetical protein